MGSSRECWNDFWFILYCYHLVECLGETTEDIFPSVLIASQCSLGSCVGVIHEVIMGVQWPLHLEVLGPHTVIKYISFFLGRWIKILLRGPQWKIKEIMEMLAFQNGIANYQFWWTEVDSHFRCHIQFEWFHCKIKQKNCSTIECEMNLKRLDF